MKRSAALLLGIALGATAYAQKEQWLDYHMSREGRSYHTLKLTTNAPPGIKLPELKGQPYFAHWVTPMDPGRALAVPGPDKEVGPV